MSARERTCPKCGAPMSEDDQFCGVCGMRVVEVNRRGSIPDPAEDCWRDDVPVQASYPAGDRWHGDAPTPIPNSP